MVFLDHDAVAAAHCIAAAAPADHVDDAEKWIENAKSLLPGDYREEVYKAKTGVDALSCNHEDTETFLRCKRCHKWLKQ